MGHYCYLLASSRLPENKCYVGYSADPFVRLLQHNGDLPDGAEPTKKHRPWYLVAVVSGFSEYFGALAFEYSWQFPTQQPLVTVLSRRGLWPQQKVLARARGACRQLWRGRSKVTSWNMQVLRCLMALEHNAELRVQYYAPPTGVQLPAVLQAELPAGAVLAPLPQLAADVVERVARRAAAKRARGEAAPLPVPLKRALDAAPLPLAAAAAVAVEAPRGEPGGAPRGAPVKRPRVILALPPPVHESILFVDAEGDVVEVL
jgi:predicted GIY-YIG superfamily endonuclease